MCACSGYVDCVILAVLLCSCATVDHGSLSTSHQRFEGHFSPVQAQHLQPTNDSAAGSGHLAVFPCRHIGIQGRSADAVSIRGIAGTSEFLRKGESYLLPDKHAQNGLVLMS